MMGGQGVWGSNAQSLAGLRRVGGGRYGERGKAAIQGPFSSPAAEKTTVPAGARRWGRASVGEIVIAIGSARVRVARGFDGSLLGEVVRAMGAAAR
ncbi:MAG: hypothetical protein WBY94_15595 [Polyangiaceae bacterium]